MEPRATIFDLDAVERIRSRNAVQPHRIKHFRNALFKNALEWDDALSTLPAEARDDFRRCLSPDCLDLDARHDSKIDGASKLIFRTEDHHLIESVLLRPKTGRTSLCISSQVGCACYCSFCATGMMGFTRNLTTAEILDQVTQAARMVRPEGRSIRNIVFMGMGEPLLNLDHLFGALDFLTAAPLFNLSPARLTVSTVGIPPGMRTLAERFPEVQQALSLHSARQEVREKLMPQARRYPLDQLRETMIDVAGDRKIMIEYLMLAGINDSEEDLQALIHYLDGLPVHINIIPFNDNPGSSFHGTPQPQREAFASALKAAGFDTTLRYSLGSDIEAACGQLVQRKKRAE